MTDIEHAPYYEECLVTFFDVLGFRNLLHTRSSVEIRHLLSMFRRLAKKQLSPKRKFATEPSPASDPRARSLRRNNAYI
jgi:hypothetical protein